MTRESCALLLIDLQEAFFQDPVLSAARPEVLGTVHRLAEGARRAVDGAARPGHRQHLGAQPVLGHDAAQEWLGSVRSLLLSMIPGYLHEGKRLATLGVGCTGGKHRSTSLAEELARRLRADQVVVHVVHRDLGLE